MSRAQANRTGQLIIHLKYDFKQRLRPKMIALTPGAETLLALLDAKYNAVLQGHGIDE